MKTKKKTYVLLILVIGVWGTVAFRIISALNPEIPDITQKQIQLNENYKINVQVDTFSIAEVNRDPFLGTYRKPIKKKFPKKKKTTIQWKPISYQGMVQKKSSGQIFIININNNQYLMRKGDKKDSVKLINGNKTYVTMTYKNQSKRFYINKGK